MSTLGLMTGRQFKIDVQNSNHINQSVLHDYQSQIHIVQAFQIRKEIIKNKKK